MYNPFSINNGVLEFTYLNYRSRDNTGYLSTGTEEQKIVGITSIKNSLNSSNMVVFQNGKILTTFNDFDPTKDATGISINYIVKFKKQQ